MTNTKKQRREFLNDFSKAFGIDRDDTRRSVVARVHRAFGDKQCREWIAQADGDFSRWNELADLSKALEFAKQKSAAREARLDESRHRENVNPTVVSRDPQTELANLRQQLEDELSKDGNANQFLLAGLRERIAELIAETGTPKI